MNNSKLLACALIAFGLLSGCTSAPRVVTAITSNRDQIKFLYVEGGSQGVLKCKVAPDGALSECKSLPVILEE